MKVVALYGRVSKREGQDTENQLARLREFCSRSGWQVVAEYIDHASGKNHDRQMFKAMFVDASRRKFDAVVTWSLDRLSREGVAMTFEHIKALLSYGVQFISYTEPHFRTNGPAGELMIALAAWIAQQERLRISERTRAGLAVARRKGSRLGRPPVVVDRAKVQDLAGRGLTTREIGAKLGCSAATVSRMLRAE